MLLKAKLFEEPAFLKSWIDRWQQLLLSENDDIALRAGLGVANFLEPPKTAEITVNNDQRRVVVYSSGQDE